MMYINDVSVNINSVRSYITYNQSKGMYNNNNKSCRRTA